MFNRKEEKIVPGKHVIDEDMLTSDEQNKKLSNKQKLKKAKRSKRNTEEEKCKVCDNKNNEWVCRNCGDSLDEEGSDRWIVYNICEDNFTSSALVFTIRKMNIGLLYFNVKNVWNISMIVAKLNE